MNHALCENPETLNGSCSLYYVFSNHSEFLPNLSIKDILSQFSLQDTYDIYLERITQLQQHHDRLSRYGNMLLISIPRAEVLARWHILPVAPDTGKAQGVYIENLGRTTDPATIISILKQDATRIVHEPHAAYTLPITSAVLDPATGPKMYEFYDVDEQAYAEYVSARDKLINEIITSPR